MPAPIPAHPGSYVLILHLARDRVIPVGRLGPIAFRAGYYLYVGSARGPGGLRSRLDRHLRQEKTVHWHIDYLRQWARPVEVWFQCGPEPRECLWFAHLREGDLSLPSIGFGASDCACPTHLLYTARRPDWTTLQALGQPGDPPLNRADLGD